MAVGEGQDPAGHPSRSRVSVQEAAEHLGTTVDAIRKRVQRHTIAHEKDVDGRVWILPDTDRTRYAGDQDSAGQRQDNEPSPLISEMRGLSRTSGSNSKPSGRPTPKPGASSPRWWSGSRP